METIPLFAKPSSTLRRVPVLTVGFRPPPMSSICFKKLEFCRNGDSTASSDELKGLNSTNGGLPTAPNNQSSTSSPDLRFDRLQVADDQVECQYRRIFGNFFAREVLFDEEYWVVAMLRAECQWEEDRPDVGNIPYLKTQFAQKVFKAIKMQCTSKLGEKRTCIVAVRRNQSNDKQTVLKSIVGTLDISMRRLFSGETFPGEIVKPPVFGSRAPGPGYGYIANLYVPKSARRRGVASNMLLLALEIARSNGANEVFVHVSKNNVVARQLYEKIGFQIVEAAAHCLLVQHNYLMHLKI
ncbi:Peptide alpha-N-acetyltransferase protein [Dioscorea alata]|uniref:Peptide alpha-N-acetyltransferase protein n=1 Tax=Dioscorea alata TaxID=55571 RepID=A0ACB7U8C0_DIOAL|nr:Peptide alpha-N-acetyltransferase protein [Dioscorea alata]